ncbi:ABC-three component system middle component 8 [Collinsella tanakaei]|uniref:ABC-three component system middle component 8 n=1 Tax=Collinsella tanakaei TaxID=626935 RepID=UPI002942C017|nr:ABC-three component system middle component 8 [Collinsella tanakaei]
MTIKPNKHSNPDQTIIGVAALILKTLSKSGVEKYDNLEELVDEKIDGGKYLFLPALNLLYLLGAVDYHKKADAFEYVGAAR